MSLDANQVIVAVVGKYPFTLAVYPALARLNEDERFVFILTHVLRHQAKALRINVSSSNVRENGHRHAREIIFTSIQFAHLAGWNSLAPEKYSVWKRAMPGPKRFDVAVYLGVLDALHHSFTGTVAFFEPADHGNLLKREELQVYCDAMLTRAFSLAGVVGYQASQFEEWLELGTASL